ncbi:MAG TPA: hypothetical protein VK833_08700, partial [Gillisia sp.]|nr:hypothetical protein [Gillisia sp.]
MKRQINFNIILAMLLSNSFLIGQIIPDSVLLAEIIKIKAIDNHSHYLPFNKDAVNQPGPEDALGKPPFPYPVRLRVDNPEYIESWKFLYNYKYNDMSSDHIREVLK